MAGVFDGIVNAVLGRTGVGVDQLHTTVEAALARVRALDGVESVEVEARLPRETVVPAWGASIALRPGLEPAHVTAVLEACRAATAAHGLPDPGLGLTVDLGDERVLTMQALPPADLLRTQVAYLSDVDGYEAALGEVEGFEVDLLLRRPALSAREAEGVVDALPPVPDGLTVRVSVESSQGTASVLTLPPSAGHDQIRAAAREVRQHESVQEVAYVLGRQSVEVTVLTVGEQPDVVAGVVEQCRGSGLRFRVLGQDATNRRRAYLDERG